MAILQTLSIVFSVIVCALLLFLILIQSGKGGSIGIFGGASSTTPFGASTMDVVTKFTWWLTAAFFAFAILAALAFAEGTPSAPSPSLEEQGGAEKATELKAPAERQSSKSSSTED